MSLYIDTDKVTHVMVGNEWLTVAENSFDLDSYEFHTADTLVHGGGNSGVCSTGFAFKMAQGGYVAGPLTAIQAVRYGGAS